MKKTVALVCSLLVYSYSFSADMDLQKVQKLTDDLEDLAGLEDEDKKPEVELEKESTAPDPALDDILSVNNNEAKQKSVDTEISTQSAKPQSSMGSNQNDAPLLESLKKLSDSDPKAMPQKKLEEAVDQDTVVENKEDLEDDAIVSNYGQKKVSLPAKDLPLNQAEELTFDIEQKRQDTLTLVKMAVEELSKRPLDIACNRFTNTKDFIKGDLYIFLYNTKGICLAHGADSQLVWKDLYELKDWVGTPIVQEIIKTAKAGGGWVTYGWHNATKVSYVELVEKEGQAYIVGSGYFPHSKEEAVVNLVKGGVALFDKVQKEGRPADWAFSRLSYPSGAFVTGNLYLYALDFTGKIMAQGERPGLIGSNAWDYKDENGKLVNQEIIKLLKGSTKGVWVDYISKRAPKKAYAEKIKDKDGTEYFIACGYYPDADRQHTVDLVRKAYQFMKTHGKANSVQEFSERRSDDYRYGDLFITVYDLQGKVIADGGNVDDIGQNFLNKVDEDGLPYVKTMLKRASKQGIWINSKIKGSFKSTYAQKIDLGVGQFVIAASYYPISKSETMILLVQSAASYLSANTREQAFGIFTKQNGRFKRGDLELVVVDTSGLCYVYGDDFDIIWRNIFDQLDDKGRPFIKMFINESQQGPVVIKTNLNNAAKYNYVMSLEKDGKTYVISSGYYQ